MSVSEHPGKIEERPLLDGDYLLFLWENLPRYEWDKALQYWPKLGHKIIVKIQMPIVGNTALLYNEDSSFMLELSMRQGRYLMRDRLKAYFWATYTVDAASKEPQGKYGLIIGEMAEDQPW